MASRDLHNNIKATLGLAPQAISGNATATGPTIDTSGFLSVEWAIVAGSLGDGVYTPAIYESDDSGMSGETAVAAAGDLLGTLAGATFTASDGVKAEKTLALPHVDTVLRAVGTGLAGNSITIAFASGSSNNTGDLTRVGTAFTFTFKSGTTTRANFESAVAALTGSDALIEVKTAGTGSTALGAGDVASAAAFTGGADASVANTTKKIGYRGSKRYARLKVASTSVVTGGTLSAVAVLGSPRERPVA